MPNFEVIRPDGSGTPFLVMPGLAPENKVTAAILRSKRLQNPIYEFALPQEDGLYLGDIDKIVETYLTDIQSAGFEGPYNIVGFSLGGQIGFTLASRMKAQGYKNVHLFLVDDDADTHRRALNIANTPPDMSFLSLAGYYVLDRNELSSFGGPMTLFRATHWGLERKSGETSDWEFRMRRPFDVYDFPFRHNDMVVAPFCDEWVDLMANILEGNIEAPNHRVVAPRHSDLPPAFRRGFAKGKQGDLEEEIRGYERAIKMMTAPPEWLFINLAQALADAGRTDDAISALRRAIHLSTGLSNCHVELAKLLRANGKKGGLRKLFERVDGYPKTTADDHQMYGIFLAQRNRPLKALAAFKEALHLEPTRLACYLRSVRILKERNMLDEAEALVSQAVKDHPDHLSLQELLASIFLDQEKPEQAEPLLRAILQQDPTRMHACMHLCKLLMAQGQLDQALDLATQTQGHHPGNAAANALLGSVQQIQGDLAGAKAQFETSLRIAQDRVQTWLALSQVVEQLEGPEKALQYLARRPQSIANRPGILEAEAALRAQQLATT
ncbi:hypothetical protein NBRC116590_10490 [Pelagimonas sp. KU-00592-HH]|uniref:tetratricopeptide repeat protein n=1 Tax=Pelagimonas sp. KU-00592-HH TaxID=3127651 RepID=UPI00310AAC2C